MKKSPARNSRRDVTTTTNLEARFDSGRTVLDYFDPARAVVTHGGARPGAIRRFEACARRQKLPHFSAALEAASHLV